MAGSPVALRGQPSQLTLQTWPMTRFLPCPPLTYPQPFTSQLPCWLLSRGLPLLIWQLTLGFSFALYKETMTKPLTVHSPPWYQPVPWTWPLLQIKPVTFPPAHFSVSQFLNPGHFLYLPLQPFTLGMPPSSLGWPRPRANSR